MSGEQFSGNYHKDIAEKWDKKAEAGWGEDGEPSPFFDEFYHKYKDEIGPAGSKVLDIGCGKGRHLIIFAKDGYKTTGLELSEKMLASAQEKLAAQKLEVELVRGKSSELPFQNQSYDFVISTGAIHHNLWPDIARSFAEVGRVLKPGKLFFFQGRSIKDTAKQRVQIQDYGCTAVDIESGVSKEGIPQHYFTSEELKELANESGLEILDEPQEWVEDIAERPGQKHARWWVTFRKKDLKEK